MFMTFPDKSWSKLPTVVEDVMQDEWMLERSIIFLWRMQKMCTKSKLYIPSTIQTEMDIIFFCFWADWTFLFLKFC